MRIGRSNLTIAGIVNTSAQDTVLKRAQGYAGTLLVDAPLSSTGLTSITIRDLTIDGNHSQQTGAFSTFATDVQFLTTNSLLITNVRIVNSPYIALALIESPSGVVVNNSYFGNAAGLGMLSTPGRDDPPEVPDGYLRCSSLPLADGIVVANSTFEDQGESAFHFDGTNIQVLNNTFNHNKWKTLFNDSGGQIGYHRMRGLSGAWKHIHERPSGANGHWADGIETHGTNVSLVDNVVEKNAGVGRRAHVWRPVH